MPPPPAILWLRRDLRVTDHAPLHAAIAASGGQVIPIYIPSTWQRTHRWTGEGRQRFLCGALASLEKNLAAQGGRLLFRSGRADEVLDQLMAESGAGSLHFHQDPDPFGVQMEERVARVARHRGVKICPESGIGVHERAALATGAGKPYRVYTPYARAWRKLPLAAPLAKAGRFSTPAGLASEPCPTPAHWGLAEDAAVSVLEPGERAARARFQRFLTDGLAGYAARRNLPAGQTTSHLGPALRYGLLSAREVVQRAREAAESFDTDGRAGAETFVGEIIWRDFYLQLLWHFPEVLELEFNPEFRGLPWQDDPDSFERWGAGQTGFPIVDAGMRQLAATGFMHNRVRMIVSMFLTKDLHLDWRLGERWFLQRLIDGEIASNNGGWQWSAGCGADAAPYFRIQNPWTQGATYDADGAYIRTWVPELRDVPAGKLHEPPAPGMRLAPGYPLPMVSHAREREETLRLFKAHLQRVR